jgi:hypothetical protein
MTSKKLTTIPPTIAGKMMESCHFQPNNKAEYDATQTPEAQLNIEFYGGSALALPIPNQKMISCHFSQLKQPMIAMNMMITNLSPGAKMVVLGPDPKPHGNQPPPTL